jgi:hypothetical protein
MFSEIAALVTSVKVASDIGRALIATADEIRRQELVKDFNNALLDIQARAMGLQSRNAELEEQLRAVNDWADTASRYRLVPVGVGYAQKLIVPKDDEADHLACDPCFQIKVRATMRREEHDNGAIVLTCSVCQKRITEQVGAPMQPINYGKDGWMA